MISRKKPKIEESRKTGMGELHISGDEKQLEIIHRDNSGLVEHIIHAERKLRRYKINLNQLRFMEERMMSKSGRRYMDYTGNPQVRIDTEASLEAIISSIRKEPIKGLTNKERARLLDALVKELILLKGH